MKPHIKGKNYERDIAKKLAGWFKTKVRRTPMSGAIHDFMSGDIICIDQTSIINRFQIECKKREKLNFWRTYEKTKNLAPVRTTPIVIATKNFYPDDLVVISLEDFKNLLLEIEEKK